MAHATRFAQDPVHENLRSDSALPGASASEHSVRAGQVESAAVWTDRMPASSKSVAPTSSDDAPGAPAASEAHPSSGESNPATTATEPLRVPEIRRGLPLNDRPAEVARIAVHVFAMTSSWVDFYRAILGPSGVARKLFKGADQNRFWESTPEFFQVQEMLTAIRSHDDLKSDSVEPLRMITIRLPISMHEALKMESNERGTSINKLCLSKLLNGIDQKLIPAEKGRIRGRKPGPQGKRKVKTAE